LFSFDGETGEAESSVFFMDCSGLSSVVLTSPDSAFFSVFLKSKHERIIKLTSLLASLASTRN
jgi:hypothetical protein